MTHVQLRYCFSLLLCTSVSCSGLRGSDGEVDRPAPQMSSGDQSRDPARETESPSKADADEADVKSAPDASLEADTRPLEVKNTVTTKIHFKALVEDVKMLSQFSGEVRPVHIDPRYVIVVKVRSVSPRGKGIQPNQTVVFAIHSPARTFHGENAKGRTFDFSIERNETGGAIRWRALTLERP